MPRQASVLEVAGRDVALSNPDKVFFPELGATKLDLAEYYVSVGSALLDALGGRPALLERFPDGAGKKSFFQKRVPSSAPEWLQTTVVTTPNGTTSRALVLADVAHVLWAVNLGCLGFHVWPYRWDHPSYVDELRVDLDPQPGVSLGDVRDAALIVRSLLEELGIESRPKTSGGRGIHVYCRLERRWGAVEVRAAAVALARELERRQSDLFTASWWKEGRGRRVFVDFNQNAPHKTVLGAWSVRPRPGAQVSTPLDWDEVAAVEPDGMTIMTVPARLRELGDPWSGMARSPQSIEALLAMSERDLAAGLPDAPWPPVYPKQPGEPPRVAPGRARKGQS